MIRTLACSILLAFLAGVPANAQQGDRSSTTGFLLNGHVGGTAGNVEDGGTEAGFGGGFLVGYGFSPQWQIFIGGDASSMDISNPALTGGYTVYQGDIGARMNFPDPTAAARSRSSPVCSGPRACLRCVHSRSRGPWQRRAA